MALNSGINTATGSRWRGTKVLNGRSSFSSFLLSLLWLGCYYSSSHCVR